MDQRHFEEPIQFNFVITNDVLHRHLNKLTDRSGVVWITGRSYWEPQQKKNTNKIVLLKQSSSHSKLTF